ncbi:protein of unknown function [endosymbiont DhMRE of Dentiscutata heterogama]|uniref:hypothetical protein n=1 Tax=endosymbiont DhMRE of Dentiscutata heterogama TaxID=1609546 RepID=UPI000629D4C9|nr:hypothetical protein [endosymbiont DhMRE of Dentiscutata heterogama]CFW93030.1 protein of unknown function [endosymbiont DhMRE of Dentiscutata heterogama]
MAALVTNYSQSCKILGVSSGASQSEIKKAYHKLILKWSIDKWKQNTKQGKSCSNGKCGLVPRDGGERWFHSNECKKVFETVERNRNLVQEAYDILTGKNTPNPSGGRGQQPPPEEECDRCGKKYDFATRFEKFKGKGFFFCSKKCYDCFNVCDNCGKIERLKENELRQGIWKEKGWGMTKGKVFCSSNCRQKLEKNPGKFDTDSLPNCDHCGEKFRLDEKGFYTIYSFTGREEKFCSPKCRTEWGNKNQEKPENNSETQQTNGPTSENGEEEGNETNDSDLDDHSESNSDNSSDSNPDQDGKSDNNLPKNIQEIANLPLLQAQARARQKIEKLLKDNDISDHELNQEDWLGKSDWKDYLKNLDTSQKVAEFANKVQQTILQKMLAKKTTTSNQKNPESDWVLPTIILGISLLSLITLLIIVRRRRQRR